MKHAGASSLDVTVPCPACGAAVGFPGRVCPSCSAPVPHDVVDALERRLEAADDDFREARANIRSASTILLLVALTNLVVALGKYLLEVSSDFESAADRTAATHELWVKMILSAAFLGCAAWVKRSPFPATAAGLVLWLALQVMVASPLSWMPIGVAGFANSFFRLAVLLFLLRGVGAAARGQALIRRMTR